MSLSQASAAKELRGRCVRFLRGEWAALYVETHGYAPPAEDDTGAAMLAQATFGTYGAFGKSTHKLIAIATANSPQPLFSPWVKPGPKAHAYLLFGFTLARANARTLINAEAKRRSARNSVRASRPQCTSAVAVLG